MTSDLFNGYRYDKSYTENSPIVKGKMEESLVDYSVLVHKNKGKTSVKGISVIDMDSIKTAKAKKQKVPTPPSMDIAFVVSKINKCSSKKTEYILADFKFGVMSPKNICKNVPNESIKGKFKTSREHIMDNDSGTIICDIAYFIFDDKDFEQIKNAWSRRNFNSPKNKPIKQSVFEILFQKPQ